MIALTFACGHTATIAETDAIAICPTCGERRVQTVQTRAPKFRGWCRGPSAVTESLSAVPVSVGGPHAE